MYAFILTFKVKLKFCSKNECTLSVGNEPEVILSKPGLENFWEFKLQTSKSTSSFTELPMNLMVCRCFCSLLTVVNNEKAISASNVHQQFKACDNKVDNCFVLTSRMMFMRLWRRWTSKKIWKLLILRNSGNQLKFAYWATYGKCWSNRRLQMLMSTVLLEFYKVITSVFERMRRKH